MASFTAAIFATKQRPDDTEHSLFGYALLFEGSRPYWELHIDSHLISFVANPNHILEDGLWQLTEHCSKPVLDNKGIERGSKIKTIEEIHGETACTQARKELPQLLQKTNFSYKLISWPGAWLVNKEAVLAELRKSAIEIDSF